MKQVLLLSGGRTSGFMLKRKLQSVPNFRRDWLVVFCNTGKEMPQTLEFVHEMETRWNVPVIWLEYHRVPAVTVTPDIFPSPRRNKNLATAAAKGETVHWFKRVDYLTADRTGKPFDELLEWMSVLPNPIGRACSMQLKIRTAMRYLFSIGLKEYAPNIGIRKDEAHRAIEILANCDDYEKPAFPLIEDGMTEQDVLSFWANNDFDLQLRSFQGNCDLCFLKAKWKRVLMAQENPASADWWAGWEAKKALTATTGNGAVFRIKEPYSQIKQLAVQPWLRKTKMQKSIDDEIAGRPAKTDDKDIPCSCAERAFTDDNCEV